MDHGSGFRIQGLGLVLRIARCRLLGWPLKPFDKKNIQGPLLKQVGKTLNIPGLTRLPVLKQGCTRTEFQGALSLGFSADRRVEVDGNAWVLVEILFRMIILNLYWAQVYIKNAKWVVVKIMVPFWVPQILGAVL